MYVKVEYLDEQFEIKRTALYECDCVSHFRWSAALGMTIEMTGRESILLQLSGDDREWANVYVMNNNGRTIDSFCFIPDTVVHSTPYGMPYSKS